MVRSVKDGSPSFLQYLSKIGIYIGARITIVDKIEFDRSLEVYGQEGLPCSRCGTPIVRVAFMNRSSYFCPRCQPRPRRRSA